VIRKSKGLTCETAFVQEDRQFELELCDVDVGLFARRAAALKRPLVASGERGSDAALVFVLQKERLRPNVPSNERAVALCYFRRTEKASDKNGLVLELLNVCSN
jgi:hypothetical protein